MTRHSENTPILYRNVLDALPSDFAREAFLWAVERPGEDRFCYRAEKFAREVDYLVRAIGLLTDARDSKVFKNGGALLDEDQSQDLINFMLRRHANWRYGGNVRPAYAGRAAADSPQQARTRRHQGEGVKI